MNYYMQWKLRIGANLHEVLKMTKKKKILSKSKAGKSLESTGWTSHMLLFSSTVLGEIKCELKNLALLFILC